MSLFVKIPVWCQKKCEPNSDTPVIWDYHVIGIHKSSKLKKSFVFDFDATLEFPVSFEIYSQRALCLIENIHKKFVRKYRVVSGKYYVDNFASDRSHMLNKETGEYMSETPTYACIQNESKRIKKSHFKSN